MIAQEFPEAYNKGLNDCIDNYEINLHTPNPYPKPDQSWKDSEWHAYHYGWNSIMVANYKP